MIFFLFMFIRAEFLGGRRWPGAKDQMGRQEQRGIWRYHKPALSTQRVHIAYQYAAAKSNMPAKKYML